MKTKTLKESVQIFLIVVLAVFAVFSLVKFDSLSEQVKELQFQREQLLIRIEEQDAAIDEIHENVDEQLRKQASLFSSIDYRYEGFSAEDGTVNMILSVIPKTISEDMKISVMLDDRTAEFVKNENDVFIATIPTYIFSEGDAPLILMEANGERKTELLDHVETEYLFVDYLPSLYADVEGVANYNQSTGKLKMDASLTVEYTLANLFGAHFVDMDIVVKTNDKEIAREDITNNVKGTSKDKITSGTYTAPFTDTYTVILGEDFYVYLVATDSLGYTHEYLAYHWLRSTDHVTPELIDGGEMIYNSDGTVLYDGK
ncbi:MAG: hypothetical protein IJ489_05220 [Clostridia bacterium]|nr:hypothetical protein [Clostridia bacterium]